MLEKLSKCFKCDSYFTSSIFKEHLKSHLDKTKIKAEEDQEIVNKFQDTNNEIIHKSGKRGYKCKQCDKTFTCIRSVIRHIETVHKKLKKFKCDDCEKIFGQIWTMKRHVETIHKQLKNFKCNHCEMKFSQIGTMKRHVNTIHRKFRFK